MYASERTVGVDDSGGLGEKALIAVGMCVSNAISNRINSE